jgi:phospholipid transport system transporter-binding protein
VTDAALTWGNGRLDLAGAVTITMMAPLLKQMEEVIANVPAAEIVLNCEGMILSDSAAIALLVEIHRRTHQRGGTLRIEGVREQLVSLINIYGVEWVLGDDSAAAP